MWGKSTAAVFLGMPLAALAVGCIALLSDDQKTTTLPLLLMFFLAWVGAMTCAFLFKTGLRAWLWMGGAVIVGFTLLHFSKAAGLLRITV